MLGIKSKQNCCNAYQHEITDKEKGQFQDEDKNKGKTEFQDVSRGNEGGRYKDNVQR